VLNIIAAGAIKYVGLQGGREFLQIVTESMLEAKHPSA
jgi:hypothetical protein